MSTTKNPNDVILLVNENGRVKRIVLTTDVQVGTVSSPAELQLTGKLILNSRTVDVNAGGTVVINDTDNVVNVNIKNGSGNVSVLLPNLPKKGTVYYIKDAAGKCKNNNIIIKGNGLIDGSSTQNLKVNYGSILLAWSGDNWSVLNVTTEVSSSTGITGVTAGTGLIGGGTSGNVTLSINNSIVATVSGTTFTGVTKHNAGLSGSLTRLIDGTSYLVAGNNVTITTGSNGAVTIGASLAGGAVNGTGTTGKLAKFTASTTVGDSLLSESSTTLTSAGTAFTFTNPQVWTLDANTSALDIVRSGGSTVMKLDSSNYNVGINVSPSDKLHIALNDSQTIDAFSATGSRIIRLQNTNSTNGNSVSIIGSDGSNQMNSYIRFVNVDHSLASAITFGTSNSGGSNKGERVRINESGYVGIGTTNPSQLLHVAGDVNVSSGAGIRINNTATSGEYLRGNGTRFVSSAIQVADVPTLNQNTTGQAGSVANSVTFNNGGAGDSSGASFNGSAAKTISYNTIGAPSTDGTNATGTWSISVTGNAGTATTLQTARNINGTSFNGSADITVPVNTSQKSDNVSYNVPFVSSVTAGNQSLFTDSATDLTYNPSTNTLTTTTFSGGLSGNATTATTLQTARNINGTSFDGSADVTVPVNTTQKSDNVSYNLPFVSSVSAGNQSLYTDSAAHLTYNPSTNTLTTTTFSGALSGNATTATTLQTTRTLWGQNFNGSGNVTGDLSSVGNITGTSAVTLTATAGTLGLVATGANAITATTNGVEALKISYLGQVGMGTSPSTQLHVYQNTGADLNVYFQNAYSLGFATLLRLGGASSFYNAIASYDNTLTTQNWYIGGNGSVNTLTFQTSTTEAMRINSSQNVGIGTNSPSNRLHINGGSLRIDNGTNNQFIALSDGNIELSRSGGSPYIDLKSTTGADYDCRIQSAGTGTTSDFAIITSGYGEVVRFTYQGRVGIGTNDPKNKVHILGSSNDTVNRANSNLTVEGGSGNGLIFGTYGSSAYPSYIQSGFVSNFSTATYALSLNPLGGNVGIGTSSPGSILDVVGDGSSTVNVTFNQNGSGFGSSSGIMRLRLGTHSFFTGTNRHPYIEARGDFGDGMSPSYASGLALGVHDGSSAVEVIRVSSQGKVGIGTNVTTNTRLTILGTSTGSDTTLLVKHNVANGANLPVLEVKDSSNNSLIFVSGSGNVGIGESQPPAKLVVGSATVLTPYGSTPSNAGGSLQILGTGQWVAGAIDGGGLELKSDYFSGWRITPAYVIGNLNNLVFSYRLSSTTWTDLITMSSNTGYVGIGTTTPLAQLDVSKSSGTVDIRLSNASTAYMNLYGGSGVGSLNLLAVQNEPLVFGTNNTERMRISATGNVGIGTTGTTSARIFASGSTGHSNGVLLLKGGNASDPIFLIRTSLNTPISAFDATGSLGVGTYVPGSRLHVVDGNIKVNNTYGIDFTDTSGPTGTNATATLEILKDYEEGTWEPVLQERGGGGVSTMGAGNVGHYVKVGRMVTATCRMVHDDTTGTIGTGQAEIADLPYACNASIWGGAAVSYYEDFKTGYVSVFGRIYPGDSTIRLYANDNVNYTTANELLYDNMVDKGVTTILELVATYMV